VLCWYAQERSRMYADWKVPWYARSKSNIELNATDEAQKFGLSHTLSPQPHQTSLGHSSQVDFTPLYHNNFSSSLSW